MQDVLLSSKKNWMRMTINKVLSASVLVFLTACHTLPADPNPDPADYEILEAIGEVQTKCTDETPCPIELRPIKARITSGWKYRKHPVFKLPLFHYGLDFAAPHGTDVIASGDGIVSFVGVKGTYGNVIEIDHGKYITRYCHLSCFNEISVGDYVEAGDKIAEVGDTGAATGSHLHYEVLFDGKPIRPYPFIPDRI